MLKDEYTVFYVTFVLIGLFFKLLVIDTYYKDELEKKNSCSMFVSTYLPEAFFLLGTYLFMQKTALLQYIVKDNETTYRQKQKIRVC